jgi:hypothetical protein
MDELLPPPPMLTRIATCAFTEVDNESDESIIVELPPQPPMLCRSASVSYNDDDACIFAMKREERRSPIEVRVGSPGKSQTLSDIVAENPDRAVVSRDYCGNF